MIALLGARGMLGSDFEGEMLKPSREECDCSDPMNIAGYFDKNKVDCVINCVGFCGQQTEERKVKTHECNVIATRNIALACSSSAVKLIHITTSLAGEGSTYTVSKKYSEQIVKDYCDDYSIVRTGWIFSKNNDKGFLSYILGCLDEGINATLYYEMGTPSYARDVAREIVDNIDNLGKEEVISNCGLATRYEWAMEIASLLDKPLYFDFRERFPKTKEDSSLVGHLRHWKESLRACLCDKGYLLQN